MRKGFVIGMLCVLSMLLIGDAWAARLAPGSSFSNEPTEAERQLVVSKLASMPLSFTENKGQFGEKTKFRCNALGATFYFAAGEMAYLFSRETDEPIEKALGPWVSVSGMPNSPDRFSQPRYRREGLLVRARFVGANPNAEVVGEEMLSHRSNYFYGNDPSKWHTNVPNYSAVTYREIYPGIDLKYYGDGRSLKYDFIVKPGADPSRIKIKYDGVNSLSVNGKGELVVSTKFGDVIERVPYAYQEIGGEKRQVSCRYVILDRERFGFAPGKDYDKNYPLIIDPELSYSTYLGGSDWDWGYGIATDDGGCAYVTGETYSSDFPTANPYDGSHNRYYDVFVTKFSTSGSSLVYSTYLGGNFWDRGNGITVDGGGNAYVSGWTDSRDFPTVNPYDRSHNGYFDVFVTKLSAFGDSLLYSTYLGGSGGDEGAGIALDGKGCAYVTGWTNSTDFPTANPYDGSFNGNNDAFATKLSASGSELIYSTYLGGSEFDGGYGIVADDRGCAYVTGRTSSTGFPVANPYDGSFNGNNDAFVTKLSPSGNTLLYSTYLGGGGNDYASGIAVDDAGNAYVTGATDSTGFPVANPYDGSFNGNNDAFVTKLSPSGNTLLYSTYLGGGGNDYASGIAVDDAGNAYVTGWTNSTDFPTANPFDGNQNGGWDGFATKVSASGSSLFYSTYLGGRYDDQAGGIAVDGVGCAYVTGWTKSPDFPTVNPHESDLGGAKDAFVAKFGGGDWVKDEETGNNLPLRYYLSQNHPNPFNPITEIRYTVPRDCWVRLEVYNILSQKVATLVDGKQKAGYKVARWDASSFSSGIYFCRLEAGDFTETRKMVLMR